VGLDQDLFQTIALAFGLISLLLLLVVLSTLGRIRKALEEGRGTVGSAAQISQPAAFGQSTTPTAQAQPAQTAQPAAQSSYAEPQTTAQPQAATPAAQQAVTPAAAAADPHDQPFERDGKWWYRRGDELLVYDEGTGQWVPAPAGSGGASTAAAPAGGVASGFTPVGGAAATTQPQPAAGADTGGWKCPSCGAINGATATSCRMCFTPRA
jgi:hypothetical protein